MPKTKPSLRRALAGSLTVLSIVGLGACGSSSQSSTANGVATRPSSTATAPASSTSTATPTTTAPARKPSSSQPQRTTPTAPAPSSTPARTRSALANALSRFATCLRRNGVKIPAKGAKGSLLFLQGLKTNTPQFRQAAARCRAELTGALRAGRSATKH